MDATELHTLETAMKVCLLTGEHQLVHGKDTLYEISSAIIGDSDVPKGLFLFHEVNAQTHPSVVRTLKNRALICCDKRGQILFDTIADRTHRSGVKKDERETFLEWVNNLKYLSGDTAKPSKAFKPIPTLFEGYLIYEAINPYDSEPPTFKALVSLTDMRIGLFCTKECGEIVQVNNTFASYFGFGSAEEMMGEVKHITSLYRNKGDRHAFVSFIKDAGHIESVDGDFVKSDGEIIRLSGLTVGVKDALSGQFFLQGAVIASKKDSVTDRIIQPYVSLFDHLPEGVLVLNLEGQIVFGNSAVINLLELSTDSLKGKTPEELFRQFDKNQGDYAEANVSGFDLVRITLKEGSFSGRYVYVTPSGRRVEVVLTSTLVTSMVGLSSGIVILVRDITLKAEEQKQLLLAKQRADEANALKEVVLQNISHETRTPLTTIIGFSSILHENLDASEAELKEFARNIIKAAQQLLEVINNLLMLAEQKLEQTRYPLEPTDLSVHLQKLIAEIESEAKASGLGFKSSVMSGLRAHTNASAVESIIRLIDSNAVKFTEKGYVALRAGRVNGSFIFIEVEDTGVGIGKEVIGQIFEPFMQESIGRSRHFRGAGLGLSVCKKLAAILDADITVKSEKGSGSVFRLLIPIGKL